MPEDKRQELLQPPRSCDSKKKKKRRRNVSASISPPEHAEKPATGSLPPETSTVSPSQSPEEDGVLGSEPRTSSNKDKRRLAGSGRRRRRPPKDPLAPLPAAHGSSSRPGCTAEPGPKDSLRWEGVLEDPQAEETRLELYRANRRRRYREALLKETQDRTRQSSEKTVLSGTDPEVAPLLLRLSID